MNSTETLAREMGERIAARRKELGLSQEKLSEKSNVSIHTISSAERGIKCLRADSIIKVSAALNVSADYLLTGLISDADYDRLVERLKNTTDEKRKEILQIIDILLK